jgi:hypothetical protein
VIGLPAPVVARRLGESSSTSAAPRSTTVHGAARSRRYPGTTHDFVSLRPLEDIPATRAGVAHGGAFLHAALA